MPAICRSKGFCGQVAVEGFERTNAAAVLFHRHASACCDELPGIALVIDGRGTGAGRAGASGAVILTSKGDAVALFLGLCLRFGGAMSGQSCSNGAENG